MNPEVVSIAHNAVIAKLQNPSREVKLIVQAAISYAVAGAEHVSSFKRGSWDGRSSFLDFKEGTFPAGFVHFVVAKLRHAGYESRVIKKPLPVPLGVENPVVDAFGYSERYDYQPEVVRRLLKHGQIIAQVATGGGKSRIARIAYATINRPTLFLTTRSLLMYQMKDTFERDLGVKVSVLGDGHFGHTITDEYGNERQAVKKMCVGMVQTLISRLEVKTVDTEIEKLTTARAKKELAEIAALRRKHPVGTITELAWKKLVSAVEKGQMSEKRALITKWRREVQPKVDAHMAQRAKTIALLGMFEFVILEEAHEASGASYFEIMRHCKNAYYRLALTATPFMKSDEEANMRLMAVSGPIAIRVSEETLIDRGILAQPYFKIVPMRVKPPHLNRSTSWAAAYRLGITENANRNALIVAECRKMAACGLTSMVLVTHTAHGDTLHDMMIASGLRTVFIRGDDDHEGRKRALAKLATGEIDVLIGTSILDVGVDVPAVGHVCIAGGGKAEVALRQRIGRGLREKKKGPNLCFVTDFGDAFNDHIRAHAKQRLQIIKDTPGFDRFILENGADFDMEALGFTPV